MPDMPQSTSDAMIQSGGTTPSHSLQTYVGSTGKRLHFPTGQLRARPLCTSTTAALEKRHRTADDSISTLCVLEQAQYAVDQCDHTL